MRIPVIVLILAATAIPVELRSPGRTTFDLSFHAYDFMENVAGFLPMGIVFGELGLLRAVIAAAMLSTFAETSQFVMVHRDPGIADIVANVIGAILGAAVSVYRKMVSPQFSVTKGRGLAAAMLACALVLGVWATSGDAISTRGATSPGILESKWTFNEGSGRIVVDSSGQGLHGRLRHEPEYVPGVIGGAVKFDGVKNYIDFGHSTAFRLAGSMTISAWINSSSFPSDDAAVVSQLQGGVGYQLDTTVDKGPRTIGFKLASTCEHRMARYGKTPLALDRWYHVAGVYDAAARTLDVYLNGELDNGALLGTVTGRQRCSRSAVYVGRRSDLKGYEFAGAIGEVRIYSFALTSTEIAADMRGRVIDGPATLGAAGKRDLDAPCVVVSERDDARVPSAIAVFGVLVAVALFGLRPTAGVPLCCVISFAAGLLLVPAVAPTLPAFSRWMMPFVSVAGAASVAFAVRRQTDPDH